MLKITLYLLRALQFYKIVWMLIDFKRLETFNFYFIISK